MTIDYDRLTKITISSMKNRKLTSLKNIGVSRCDKSNIWYTISNDYFSLASSSYNSALQIYRWWSRKKEYRKRVKKAFGIRALELTFKWNDLKKFIKNNRFTSGFSEFVTTSLRKKGNDFKCLLSCVENHFLKSSKTEIWKGRYKCYDKYCPKRFHLSMRRLKNNLVGLEIVVEEANKNKNTHKKPLNKTVCNGEKRIEEAKKILCLGSSLNALNANILEQSILGNG